MRVPLRLLFVLPLVLGGCAASPPASPTPSEPTSPDAAEAPLPKPSDTLRAAPADAPAASQPSHASVYRCPMHPQVVSDHAGSCPICGMTMVRDDANGGAQ